MKITDFVIYLNYCKEQGTDYKERVAELVSKVLNYPIEQTRLWVDTQWLSPSFGTKFYKFYIQGVPIMYDRLRLSTIRLKATYILVEEGEASEPDYMIEVRRLLKEKQKLHAVKVYKESTGIGLRESKEFCDNLDLEIRTKYDKE